MLVIFVSSFCNVSLLICDSMFTHVINSGVGCATHASLCLLVLTSSSVAFVSSFCIFDVYVSRSMKKLLLLFYDIYTRKLNWQMFPWFKLK